MKKAFQELKECKTLIIDIDKQFDNKQPSRIDIIEDPDGINTDEALGYPTIKEDI